MLSFCLDRDGGLVHRGPWTGSRCSVCHAERRSFIYSRGKDPICVKLNVRDFQCITYHISITLLTLPAFLLPYTLPVFFFFLKRPLTQKRQYFIRFFLNKNKNHCSVIFKDPLFLCCVWLCWYRTAAKRRGSLHNKTFLHYNSCCYAYNAGNGTSWWEYYMDHALQIMPDISTITLERWPGFIIRLTSKPKAHIKSKTTNHESKIIIQQQRNSGCLSQRDLFYHVGTGHC